MQVREEERIEGCRVPAAQKCQYPDERFHRRRRTPNPTSTYLHPACQTMISSRHCTFGQQRSSLRDVRTKG